MDCLRPQGSTNNFERRAGFLIELFNPSLEILLEKPDRIYPRGNSEKVSFGTKSFYDTATQIKHIELIFQENNDQPDTVLTLKMRQFFPQEIDALLKYNGFRIEQKFGNHREEKFNSDSLKQLIICQKI